MNFSGAATPNLVSRYGVPRSASAYILPVLLSVVLVALVGCGRVSLVRATTPAALTPLATIAPTSTLQATLTPIPSPTPAGVFSLYFASDRGEQSGIYRLHRGEDAQLVVTSQGGAWEPAVRPTTGELAYTSYANNNGDIALVGPSGERRRTLVNHPADDYQPAWSPDGETLVFVSERDGGQDLYLLSPSGGGPPRLLTAASGLHRHRDPAWSPDGAAIIFAGVDTNGVEGLYRLDLATLTLTPLTRFPLKARMPAVSAAGEIAFIGWTEGLTRTLSILSRPGGEPRTVYSSTSWIGNPAWSADGRWLLFSKWENPRSGHDLYAIEAIGGAPIRLTYDGAWDDVPAPVPGETGSAPPVAPSHVHPKQVSESPPDLALGFNLANLSHGFLVRDVGATWVKGYVDWARTEPGRADYNWIDADNTVRSAQGHGLTLFLRIHNAPVWSHPGREAPNTPPDDPAEFGRFAGEVALRYRGQVAAYELWNEPNLAFEWGNTWPDPAAYVAMLKTAYPAIKAADPDAVVVVGALSTTGDGSDTAVGDLDFLRAMYAAGASHGVTHDVLATHPYGFGKGPAAVAEYGLGLRHVEAQRAVMLEAGDEASPLWITETGWPVKTPAWDLGNHQPWTVDFATQAAYYATLVETVERDWPFVTGLFPFNLDFSTVSWYPPSEQMRAYALLNPDGSPRPAYTALRRSIHQR